ncbi:MAG TPA: choice-of-anchor V domain-containing protein [Candidatus Dormibacteraeota bacterium]|nr:choice-of-anchor V domain-containing protein [Candidatus Dormibacteraeota bacterium]
MPSSARPALFVALSLLVAAPALAHIGGIVGFSDIGCTDCHDAQGAPTPGIAIVGPTTVDPATQVTYQVVVTSMGPTQLGAGFNFAAGAGDVAVGDDTGVHRLENREMRRFELTHTGPRENDANGQAAFSVVWITPATPGDYALFAAGNSVNLDTKPIGDASNVTVLMVHVAGSDPTPTPTVTPGATCTGDCNGDGTVAINELISGVNIALGSAPATACATMDANDDGTVAINELIAAVSRALSGC